MTVAYFIALLIAAPFIAAYFGGSLLWYWLFNRSKPRPSPISPRLANRVGSLLKFPTAETLADDAMSQIRAQRPESLPRSGVMAALLRTSRELGEAELPTVPPPPGPADAIATSRYNEMLERHVHLVSDEQYVLGVTNALVEMGLGLIDALPTSARQAPEEGSGRGTEQKLPLIDILPDPASAVEAVLSPFLTSRAPECFSGLKAALQDNLQRLGGAAPREFRGTRRELVENYLGNTPLAALFEIEIPIVIPKAA
jgi:hypothetical protein